MTGRPSILYESMSNFVRAVGLSRTYFILKGYPRRGRGNGFWLPAGRVLVEWILLHHVHRIASLDDNSLVTPCALHLDWPRRLIRMSFLRGTPLTKYPVESWPPATAWAALGRAKALLEHQSETIIAGANAWIWQAQQRLRGQVLDFRLNSVTSAQADLQRECGPYLETQPRVICLGDLTLPNLLGCGSRLGLIDFEFAYLGAAGSDIGRLVAILQTRAAQRPAERKRLGLFWRQLLAGYEEAGGDTRCAEIFAALYVCYYQHPGYTGPNVPASGT